MCSKHPDEKSNRTKAEEEERDDEEKEKRRKKRNESERARRVSGRRRERRRRGAPNRLGTEGVSSEVQGESASFLLYAAGRS